MLDGAAVARFLRQIASAVEKMDQEQLSTFLREMKTPKRVTKPGASGVKKKKNFGKIDTLSLEKLWKELQNTDSRQIGAQILEAYQPTRNELEKLAKMAQVHITKDDSISYVKEKMIEAIIGSRLGSIAIRGN